MISEPKEKKKGRTGKVSNYKESMIISKRHFHTLLDRKQSAAPLENGTFKKKEMEEEKENIGLCTMWKSWTAWKRVVDDDIVIDRGRSLTSSVGTTKEATPHRSPLQVCYNYFLWIMNGPFIISSHG